MHSPTIKYIAAALLSLYFGVAYSHDFKAGTLRIEHPYTTASLTSTGAVYFKSIINEGKVDDELLGARTTVAASVELHEMKLEGGVMKMRALSSIRLPADSVTRFMHGQTNGYHLMLQGLTKPLKDDDRFPVWLHFKHAGEKEVMVWVQAPKKNANQHEHPH